MLTCEAYLTPTTLEDAFAAMHRHAGRYRLVAGATDLLPWAREGRAGDVAIPVLIDLARIPALRVLAVGPADVRIGAATQIQRFLDHAALAAAMPCMRACALWFADDQIREAATVGGNLVNASPAADVAPGLLAHDARVEIAAWRDGRVATRTLPLNQFLLGPGRTALADGEILQAVVCAPLPAHGGSFEKVGHRRSLAISTVCLASLVSLDPAASRIVDLRLAAGGIGPVPVRLEEVEDALRGTALAIAGLERAAALALHRVQSRTRQEYRRAVLRGFIVRGLIAAARAAGALMSEEEVAAYA